MTTDTSPEIDAAKACQNTDREIWRERKDDYYADSIFVTESGGIGINCGGTCVVLPIREWHKHALARLSASAKAHPQQALREDQPHPELKGAHRAIHNMPMAKAQPAAEVVTERWGVWWHGSGPERGDHVMVMTPSGAGYARELAYLGDQHHDQVGQLVREHNEAIATIPVTQSAGVDWNKCDCSLIDLADGVHRHHLHKQCKGVAAMPPADAMIREMEGLKAHLYFVDGKPHMAPCVDRVNAAIDQCIAILRECVGVAPAVDLGVGARAIAKAMGSPENETDTTFWKCRMAEALYVAEAWGLTAAPQADDGREG